MAVSAFVLIVEKLWIDSAQSSLVRRRFIDPFGRHNIYSACLPYICGRWLLTFDNDGDLVSIKGFSQFLLCNQVIF